MSKGCAKIGSYINAFHNRYWSDIWDEFSILDESQEAKPSFYEKYKDRYVSEYAATNTREDIAEVFATFVVSPDRVEGTSIAEQKIQNDFLDFHETKKSIRLIEWTFCFK